MSTTFDYNQQPEDGGGSTGTYYPQSSPTATNSSDGVATAVRTETYSSRSWGPLCFFLIWTLGVCLLISTIVLWRLVARKRTNSKKYHQSSNNNNNSQNQVDENQNNNHNNNDDDDIEQSAAANTTTINPIVSVSIVKFQRLLFAISIFASMTAIVLSIYAQTTCEFVGFDYNSPNPATNVDGWLTNEKLVDVLYYVRSFGLWSVSMSQGDGNDPSCVPDLFFTDEGDLPPDVAVKVARGSAIIASVVGGFAWFVLIFVSMNLKEVDDQKKLSSLQGNCSIKFGLLIAFVVTACVQLLTLFFFTNRYCNAFTCNWEFGAIGSITAVWFWIQSFISLQVAM